MKRTIIFLPIAILLAGNVKATSPARDDDGASSKRSTLTEGIAGFDDFQRRQILDQSLDAPPSTDHDQNNVNLFDVPGGDEAAGWSAWSHWTDCSRSCGGGVSSRVRRCISLFLPTKELRCKGISTESKLCNPKNCSERAQDFRELQCTRQNEKLFHGKNFRWIPFFGKDTNSCELTCMAKSFHFYHSFGIVLDGTRCGNERKGICVQGKCVAMGCDGMIESNLTEDMCGVCGGNNSTCFRYQRLVDRLPVGGSLSGYNKVATIPIGATHIQVKDYNRNHLALAEVHKNEETYVINGNWIISWAGEFKTAGTLLTYNRTGAKETFSIVGPTTVELRIMVLCLGQQRPLLQYEYWLSNSETEKSGKLAELKMQRFAMAQVPSDDDYRALILSSGLDFDAVTPPTLAPTALSSKVPVATIPQATSRTSATNRVVVTTTVPRTKVVAKSKTGLRQYGSRSACASCKRISIKKKVFCESDFAVHARVLPRRRLQRGRYARYQVEIFHTYKSVIRILRREYIWMSTACCPRLRPYRHYLLMGRRVGASSRATLRSAKLGPFQTRLLVETVDFWFPWKKSHIRMARIAKHANCKRHRYTATKYHRTRQNEG